MFKRKMTKEMKNKMMEIWEDAVKKQIQFEELSNSELNYQIIQDLVNSARAGIRVEVTLKDGSKLVIKPETPFDNLQNRQLF